MSSSGDTDQACNTTVWWVNQYAVVPSSTGGTRHFDMAAELRRQGFDARIVASDLSLHTRSYSRRQHPGDLRPVVEELDGVPFHWLSAGTYRANDWRRAASMVIFGVSVFGYLLFRRLRRTDVIIGSSPHLFAALGAWAAATMRRVPFVFEVRDLWPESFTAVSGKQTGPQITLMRWIADLLYRRSDAIVVLAKGSVAKVEARGAAPESVVWIPNGVDSQTFGRGKRGERRDGVTTFVYAGAHGPANGLDIVVRAAALLRDRGRDDIDVLLVGDGAIKDDLVELARKLEAPVRFRDPVPKAEVPEVLNSSSVGLMVLADIELFAYGVSPNKLFDYMAADLPVLTNVPGFVSEVVADSGCGVSVPAGDEVALADAMEAMAARLDGSPDAWSGGSDYIQQHYDRRTLAGQLAEVLQGLR